MFFRIFLHKTGTNCKIFLFRNIILLPFFRKMGESGALENEKLKAWLKVGEPD